MWQRFTEPARRVVLLAQEEASRMNSAYVGTEHLLLGLVREIDGFAAQILQMMGVDLQKLRDEIESQNDAVSGVNEPKLTPEAGHILELAAEEASRMHDADRDANIDTEHLLLGLLREKDGTAAQLLHTLGLDVEKARTRILVLYLGPAASLYAPEPKVTLTARRILQLAVEEARSMKHDEIGSGHILLALLREEDGVAAKILSEAGLDLAMVRKRVLE